MIDLERVKEKAENIINFYLDSNWELRFTYVNAGYIKLGHASVFTFTDTDYSGSYDRVRIERFSLDDESREASFGNTRYPNPYEARLSTEPGHTNRR